MAIEESKVEAIFFLALEKQSPEDLAAYLDEACANDAILRQRVEALLNARPKLGNFLQGHAANMVATSAPPLEKPGTQIGPYKLLQQIGEGGMGVVYMAEQTEPVQRKVALKVIKPGMDNRQVVARFEAERQALAMMDHVNIARVLDAGATESGRPYFVMELVHGVPITKYCDDNRLTPRQRLELFVPVCQAIQHAHQKGIIHRDIKPSNVMVTLYDGKPVPKVIDFGVAKATEQKLTERTLFTQYGTMVGTLEYMSPEQAEMSALGVDTRSDIYSLGVLLYELLTGSTPLSSKRMKEAAYAEILRLIKEEEPPKPSTRLSDSGEALASISAQRHMEPTKLMKLMRGELDWIVMKTLEKDRNRRYETASGFAADVQRYLNDEPVLACPPSVGYRLRKFMRRYNGPVLATSLLMLTLVGGIIGTTLGMIRATGAEAEAVVEAGQKTDALKDKQVALSAAERSAQDAKDQLFLALLNQARAERGSGRVGQRFKALKAIREAAQIRITPELRTEATAALVLPDAEIAHEWDGWPEGSLGVAFDARMERYARLDGQGGVTVCRLGNGREEIIARLPPHGQPKFHGVWMSPDGRFVAYGHSGLREGAASSVRVWKLDGPAPVALLDVTEGVHGYALAFSANSRRLAIGHAVKAVSVYDLATGKRLHRLANDSTAFHLAFHPRDGRLAIACGNAVRLFDADTAEESPALRHSAPVTGTWQLSWHPDGRRLAVGCNDRKIHLWDTQTAMEVMSPWTGHTSDGMGVAFNHAGDRLVSGDWIGQTRLWDAVAGRMLLTMPNVGLQFNSDDSLLGPEYSGNKIRLWRLAGGGELRVLRPRRASSLDNIVAPVLHANGRILAAAADYQLCFFDLASGEELDSARLPLADSARPAFFDQHRLLLDKQDGENGRPEVRFGGWMTGGQSGLIFWPARQAADRPEIMRIGPPQLLLPNPGGGFSNGASASADGRVVAVPQGHSTLVLYRDQPDRRVEFGPQNDARHSAVSPDGNWVVTCSWGSDGRSKTIRIWDANTGLPVRDLSEEACTSAKFSPNGRWLMTSSAHGSRQWEVDGWREVRHFDRGAFIFSPTSQLMAVGDVFSVIRLVETTTGREVARLTGPEPMWYGPVCFTPDGTQLVATCSSETAIYVWDLRLIRQQLKNLELDWEWPEFPPKDAQAKAAEPPQVEVLLGDFTKPVLTDEQKARQDIERCRLALKAKPHDAGACNDLAWHYLTAPEALRNVEAAVPLAEKAVQLDAKNAVYRNTLGVAYYRAGQYREAIEVLRGNLDRDEDWARAFDLYFLAMSHHRLEEIAQARDYFKWAARWPRTHPRLSAGHLVELDHFRAEAEKLLKPESEPTSQESEETQTPD